MTNMKKRIIGALLIVCSITLVSFKNDGKFKFNKVNRDVKKEAKKYQKDGYLVFAGGLPFTMQLEASYKKQVMTDESGFPTWIIANGSSVAQNLSAGEMQATEIAKNRLVGLIETNMKSVVEIDLANNQISQEEATSISKAIEVSVNKVSKKLTGVQVLFKAYRNVKKNVEVQVQVGYNYAVAQKALIDEMRKYQLQQESEEVRKKHEEFLNGDLKRGAVSNYDSNN